MDIFEKDNKFSSSQGEGNYEQKTQYSENYIMSNHKNDIQVFYMNESNNQSSNQKWNERQYYYQKDRNQKEFEDCKQDDNTNDEIEFNPDQNENVFNVQNKKKNKNSRKNQQAFPQQFLPDDAFLFDNSEGDQSPQQQIDQQINEKQIQIVYQIEEEFKNMSNKMKMKNNQTKEQQFEDELNKYDDKNSDTNEFQYSTKEERIEDNKQFSRNFYENIEHILDNSEQCVQDDFENDGNNELLNKTFQNNPNFSLQQGSTFSMQGYLKTTIIDHHFNGDNEFVKGKLNETILQVHQYVQKQVEERQKQIKEFEKKLKKFIFDYRYDQNHQPRKYAQNYSKLTEQNLKQKFQDPRYDSRKIHYEIQDTTKNPFSLYCNEIDVYVHTLSTETCIKQAFYNELELYLKAIFQDKCDIQSNYYSERRIYHQCINFTFKDTRLTLKIRIILQKSNLFQARDNIVNTFYEQNVKEINIFAGFVLYWAQKRKILSSQVLDKQAWTNIILYFFQVNGRLPPSLNYDILQIKAEDIEKRCYQKAEDIHKKQQNKDNKDQNNKEQQVKSNEYQMIPERVFDFKLFEHENIDQQFIIQLKPTQNNNQSTSYKNKEFIKIYKVLPIIRPNPAQIFKIKESHNFNYGFFFYKFLYFLNFQLVIDPIAISLSGRIIAKKKNNNNETQEPIAIYDTIWTENNLVSHLSYSQDAFSHFIEQIKFAYQTIYENKSQKTFLTDIQAPAFNIIRRPKA